MASFTEAGADATRDALALVRAALDGDEAALAMVAQNVSWPALALTLLARWLAGSMQGNGVGRAELDAWQSDLGLR